MKTSLLNVICLKHGTKYDPVYVNNLYNMVKRHLTVPYHFVCFTDDPNGLNEGIDIRLLPKGKFEGWWWKPYIFKQGHFVLGETNLFFDLDMVVINNLNKFLDFMPGQFVGLRDVGRVFPHGIDKLGSAVMRWPAETYCDIWERLDPTVTKTMHGDQDWIWSLHKSSIKFFPDEWIRSYKWEVRNRNELVRSGNGWRFNSVRSPDVEPETAILAFHGTPNPHEVMDPIIIDNWQ